MSTAAAIEFRPLKFFKPRLVASKADRPRAFRITADETVTLEAIAATRLEQASGYCWLEVYTRDGRKITSDPVVPDWPAPAIDPRALKRAIDAALGLP